MRRNFHPFHPNILKRGFALAFPWAIFWTQNFVYGADPQTNASKSPLSLQLDDQLNVQTSIPDNNALTFTSSKKVDGVNDRTMFLKEDAEIRRNGTVVKGDEITYNLDTDIVDVKGNAILNRPNATFRGPSGKLKLDSREGFIEEPNYELKDTRGSGKASRADFLDEDKTLLLSPTYTTCSPGNVDWYFSSRDMLIDESVSDAKGKDGVLHFFETPIFYMPYFSFPLGSERRSGFLPPTIGLSSTNGLDITSPYYLNIAPNRDLTIYPRYLSKRGEQLGGDFRYLEPTYSGHFQAEYLPNDAVFGASRWAYSWLHQQSLAPSLTAYANINRVSDDYYANDLGRTVGQAVVQQYNQEAGLNYGYNGWTFLTRVQKFQTLQPDPNNLVILPYDREPQLNARYRNLDWHGTTVSFEGDFTRFTYSGPIDPAGYAIPNRGYASADRAFVNTGISYPFITPGYYITPKISLRGNAYTMLGNDQYPGFNQSYTIPTTSLDSGMFFERSAPELKPIFGRDMLLSIEPRALYVYTPYVDQSQIPLFDTASSGFGIAQIFAENTFVGNDRIADNNKITTGVTAKILEESTGIERIRGVIAQRVDFAGQKVGLYGNQVDPPKYSDILMGLSTRLLGNINLDAADEYNQDLDRSVQSSITASWRPAPRKMINISYRYNYDPNAMYTTIHQYEISGQWPITKSVYGIGRWNFDKVSGQTLNTLAGFEYDQDCWAARVAYMRFVNTSQIATSQIFFQIEFKGLTGVGNNPINIIKLNIPGYIPVNEKPLPLSRFETYD